MAVVTEPDKPYNKITIPKTILIFYLHIQKIKGEF
jgi:hypothetical protein